MAKSGETNDAGTGLPSEMIKLARRVNGERIHVEIEDSTGRVRSIYARVRASGGQVTLESASGASFSLNESYAIRQFL